MVKKPFLAWSAKIVPIEDFIKVAHLLHSLPSSRRLDLFACMYVCVHVRVQPALKVGMDSVFGRISVFVDKKKVGDIFTKGRTKKAEPTSVPTVVCVKFVQKKKNRIACEI